MNLPTITHRLATTVALAAAVVTGPLALAATASESAPAKQSVEAAQTRGEWIKDDWFWTYDACNEAGQDEVNDSTTPYTDWACTDINAFTVRLWLWKP